MPTITTSARRGRASRFGPAAVAVPVGALILGVSSCGAGSGSGEALVIEPGACISVLDDAIQAVDCTGPDVDRVLVESLGPAAAALGTTCPGGTASMDVRTTYADGTRDIGSTWCVVSPDNLTSALQARIDDQRPAPDADGGS